MSALGRGASLHVLYPSGPSIFPVLSRRELDPSRTRPSKILVTNSENVGSQSHSLRQPFNRKQSLPAPGRAKAPPVAKTRSAASALSALLQAHNFVRRKLRHRKAHAALGLRSIPQSDAEEGLLTLHLRLQERLDRNSARPPARSRQLCCPKGLARKSE